MDKQMVVMSLDDSTNFGILVEPDYEISSLAELKARQPVFPFKPVTETIEGISKSIKEAFEKAKPDKAKVEFGISVDVKTGALTTLLVTGGGEATFKVTLEWDFSK